MQWMLMPLKRYAEFSGRSRRMEFWMWQLFKFLVGCVMWVLLFAIAGSAFTGGGDPQQLIAAGGAFMTIWLIFMLFGLAIFVPDIAVAVRRLHDTNRTGWWILAPLGPYLIGWIAIVVGVSGAKAGGNAGSGLVAAGAIGLISILAALVLAIVLIVFYFLDGTPGPNKYGPDPKGRDSGQVFA